MGNYLSYQIQNTNNSGLPSVDVTEFDNFDASNEYDVYVILGNSMGDESKGKVVRHYLLERGSKAKYCIRFNGGPNAGHTVYVRPDDSHLFITDEKRMTYTSKLIKFATHQVPTGVLFGIKCVIGYNCVVDLEKLYKEINEIAGQLGRTYQEVADLVTVVPEAHIIMPWHVLHDKANNAVGTTGSGIGPCYSEKALRTGFRAVDYYSQFNQEKFTELTEKLQALPAESFTDNKLVGVGIQSCKNIAKTLKKGDVVVMEGAQGFYLDINHGTYPHVTSSDCTIGAVCSYGFPLKNIRSVGVIKAYPTYVGASEPETGFKQSIKYTGEGELLRLLGREYGVTTGRRRQCLPLNLDMDLEAIRINQTEELIISKSDVLVVYDQVLKKLQEYCITHKLMENPESDEDRILKEFIEGVGLDKYEYFQKIVDLGAFRVIYKDQETKFKSWEEMKEFIINTMNTEKPSSLEKIIWWDNPESEVQMKD
ncbi:adenylosuccinate synthetase [Fadolivirus algeromassiliense]|jgi:adenylosuccinate synthase|uniref:Adenylosuccinate synthetase n=1 Tax=Fadolivirus FV1/VV64 TaxID=3070911 RepID=A0A7D3UUW6_9VIRU|nr:adenylosuccinate synthetase [Fadolivirus algeromassiliense]QKF94451.1 adenylosuccinate synthetase [Fadolivirus FV1/VV64]